MPPILLLALEATYHTATLLWGLPPETKDATNQTYSVIYWNYEDPNTTYSVNVGQDTEIGQTMRYILTGLNPGLLYQWTVEASTAETMSLQSVVSNFSTMSVGETDSHFYAWFCYRITGGFNCVFAAKLERLSVRVYNSSSVLVTWAAPQLPSGVRVHSYTVHYAGTALSGSGRLTVWEGPAVVAGLRSHSFYQFWVRAAVVEGSIQSDGIISSENATVFVPGINTNLPILPLLNIGLLSPRRLDHCAIKRWSFQALLQLDRKCMQSVYSALVSANLINKSACTTGRTVIATETIVL